MEVFLTVNVLVSLNLLQLSFYYNGINIPGIIGSNPELLYGVFGGVSVVTILIVTTCFTIAIITLLRAKAKLKVKLEQAEGTENGIIIYEEIKQIPPSNMDTTDNVAYASCQAFTCKST